MNDNDKGQKTTLKAYWIGTYEDGGFVYLCNNRKDALRLRSHCAQEFDFDFIDVRVNECKNVLIDDLKEGRLDDQVPSSLERARRGFYQQEINDTCPFCKKEYQDLMEIIEGTYMCLSCEKEGNP